MKLTDDEKRALLRLAREAIETYLRKKEIVDIPQAQGALSMSSGAFVTLHNKDGSLRGCIGNMVGQGPLVQTIRDMAIAAATGDPRFPKVILAELKNLKIEISVLSPMSHVKDLSEIEVGTHGLMITKGYYRGVLLPQVATEYGWDRDTFLTHLCFKAGLEGDAWKADDALIESFTAEVFGEDEK